jgi:hypothetical protein
LRNGEKIKYLACGTQEKKLSIAFHLFGLKTAGMKSKTLPKLEF